MGLQSMMYLALRDGPPKPVPPRVIAAQLKVSPTYLAKVLGLLVKAGLLESHRGTRGGVRITLEPRTVHLLDIVEACQGKILGHYCTGEGSPHLVCGYHRAMFDLHEATVSVLKRWTLGDLVSSPIPHTSLCGLVNCKTQQVLPPKRRRLQKAK